MRKIAVVEAPVGRVIDWARSWTLIALVSFSLRYWWLCLRVVRVTPLRATASRA
ncbi:hypothetical protein [Ornithinimicrobium sp. Y1694]|uniref:hypothetical protein n=1 Tax=Ornithinimicrobium sp. Y1694 TaxID=3418590 RepID=UPI003CF01AB4